MILDYYYYKSLNAKEKQAYKEIHSGIQNYLGSICLANEGYTEDEIQRIFTAITLDNPHLFYLDQQRIMTRISAIHVEVIPFYYYDKLTSDKYAKTIQKAVNKIMQQAHVEGKSDFERVKILHDILANNVSYDFDALDTKNKQNEIFAHNILGVFLTKKAVCEGIAKVFKILLNVADIKCIVVNGNAALHGKYEPHAWNIVNIEGQSYHLDSTWDVCNSEDGQINYDYFNLTDEDIIKDHSDYSGVPKCSMSQFNYFEMTGSRIERKNDLEKYIRSKVVDVPSELYIKLDYLKDNNMSETIFLNEISQLQEMVMKYIQNDGYPLTVSSQYNSQQKTIRLKVNIRV